MQEAKVVRTLPILGRHTECFSKMNYHIRCNGVSPYLDPISQRDETQEKIDWIKIKKSNFESFMEKQRVHSRRVENICLILLRPYPQPGETNTFH